MLWSTALTGEQTCASVCLKDDPATASFICHRLAPGEVLQLSMCKSAVRILFVCKGSVAIDGDILEERAVYIGDPQKNLLLRADTNSLILEIHRWLTEAEYQKACSGVYPYVLAYNQALTYTEDCKSPKTTSRMLIPPRIVPRFAMGSVQTKGEDLIVPHSHPDEDQYFFSLAENNCVALIDAQEYPYGGNTLLHIPLGSHHGVKLEDRHVCHYLWIGFLLNANALEYMDNAHKMSEQ